MKIDAVGGADGVKEGEHALSINNFDENCLPVIIVHTGHQSYLKYAIRQAEKFNDVVVLLGDKSNSGMCGRWYSINDYIPLEWRRFQNAYVHMSPNDIEYELGCFKRFFVVYEFLRRHGIEHCVHLDSDVMTFCNYTEWRMSNPCDCTLSIPFPDWPVCCAHNSYMRLNVIREFLYYCLDVYENRLDSLRAEYNKILELGNGGICDMTLWAMFAGESYFNIKNCNEILTDAKGENYVFDNNVNTAFGVSSFFHRDLCYEMDSIGTKKICLENEKCYFYRGENKVRAYTVHCQGGAKKYMRYLYYNKLNLYKAWLALKGVFG